MLADALAGSSRFDIQLCCSWVHNLQSAYNFMYSQQISNLEETHRDVYQKFGIGFHVVRRSHQCWARLGRDLVIEQTLMMFL